MPRKSAPKKTPKSQLRRAKYIVTHLRTGSDAQARHASGLKKNAKKSIIKMLEERGTIADAPRSGRPQRYSEALMRQAVKILVESKGKLLTGHKLLDIMIARHLTEANADVGHFMRQFRAYVTSIGHKLVVNSTRTIFLLTAEDVSLRVMFAQRMLSMLANQPPKMLIFVDETILEEAPHPKGTFT